MALQMGGRKVEESGSFNREFPRSQGDRYNAVCCDVHLYEGVKRKAFNGREEVRDELVIVWALGTPDGKFLHYTVEEDGKSKQGWIVTVRQPYRPSLNERANLRKLLDNWLGMTKKHGEDWPKTKDIDMEKLVGHPAEVKAEPTQDGKYLNLVWAEPLPSTFMRLPLPPADDTGYTRIKDRKKDDPGERGGEHSGPGLQNDVPPPDDPFGPGYSAPSGAAHAPPPAPPKFDDDPF